MPLTPGTQIGPYEVTGALGAGGMGEVYRAHDGRLKRDVALKLLPESFATDPERLARFQREAEVLASLNHPHIAGIRGIEEADGVKALVLELVEGETLADRITRGPIPVGEALPLAKQIAEALEAAHEHGVIHRDLKPANIKITPEGVVKVLDFGLAKLAEAPGAGAVSPGMSQSPTITSPAAMTGVGMLLGTAAYMSPEQAKGQPADKRSDVWAFGAVLYEMLTGRRAFAGEDVSDTIASVLKADTDWDAFPASVSSNAVNVIKRCLQRDRTQRARDIGDVALALEGAFETPASPVEAVSTVPPPLWRQVLPWLALVAMAIAVVLTRVLVSPEVPAAPEPTRLSFFVEGFNAQSVPPLMSWSPDSRAVIYARSGNVDRRDLGQLGSELLTDAANGMVDPVLSPDGQWLLYSVNPGSMWRVSVLGGPVQRLGDTNEMRGGTWVSNDTILFGGNDRGLALISSDGGVSTPLTTLGEGEIAHRWPSMLPDGEAALFTVWRQSLDTAQVAVVDLDTGEYEYLVGGTFPRYAVSGHLVFVREDSLWAVPFDLEQQRVIGTPVPVVTGAGVNADVGSAQFGIAADGSLSYATSASTAERSVVWVDRNNDEEPLPIEPGAFNVARLSPDQSRVAIGEIAAGSGIWILDLATETPRRLTVDAGAATPVWSLDGGRIAFSAVSSPLIQWKAANDTGTIDDLVGIDGGRPEFFVADPPVLVFVHTAENRDISMLALDGTGDVTPLISTAQADLNPVLSPDGRWMAYESGEPTKEIYVVPFPNVEDGLWRVSNTGGRMPLWSPDGGELFYVEPCNPERLMSVAVDPSGEEFVFGARSEVLIWPLPVNSAIAPRSYDISADGERFLAIRGPRGAVGGAEIIVVQNWFTELERLVPTN